MSESPPLEPVRAYEYPLTSILEEAPSLTYTCIVLRYHPSLSVFLEFTTCKKERVKIDI